MYTLLIIASLYLLASLSCLAQDRIKYPFLAVQKAGVNKLMVIEDGIAALQLRVDMIRRAKKSIEVEYFIFNTDTAGKIIATELVAAAKRGVKVRVLVDKSIAVFKLKLHFAKELARQRVDLRYYNAAEIFHISSIQFRNHRKLLSVDDVEALTGGRNIGDDYFDLSHEFNFNDRDIHVKGPIVKAMRESFERFFYHKITQKPDLTEEVSEKNQHLARALLKEGPAGKAARKRMESVGREILAKTKSHTCPVTTFASDAPGGEFSTRLDPEFGRTHRHLRNVLRSKINQVDKRLILSSPYMIHNERTQGIFNMLLAKKVKIHLHTNSLASTDAIYVAANLYISMQDWLNRGVQIYLHDGQWPGFNPQTPLMIRQARWGTHGKTQIYESKKFSEVMIGTYNVDNRSNFYNTEMAIFCRGNDELTNEVKQHIVNLTEKSLKVLVNGTAIGKNGKIQNVYGTDKKEITKMRIATVPSWLVKFLL